MHIFNIRRQAKSNWSHIVANWCRTRPLFTVCASAECQRASGSQLVTTAACTPEYNSYRPSRRERWPPSNTSCNPPDARLSRDCFFLAIEGSKLASPSRFTKVYTRIPSVRVPNTDSGESGPSKFLQPAKYLCT